MTSVLLLFQALLTAHDDIIDRNYEELPTINPQLNMELQPGFNNVNDQIRLVGIMKSETEPLVSNVLHRGSYLSAPVLLSLQRSR